VSDDPYVDPHTGVLVTLLGLIDAAALQSAEADLVFARGELLELHPLPGDYDVAHLQAFHRHLFGDVYPWAGDFRTVNIARSASFGDWRHIRTYLDQVFEDEATEPAKVFAELGDPVRLRLFSLVAAGGEVCSCDLENPRKVATDDQPPHQGAGRRRPACRREARPGMMWRVAPDRLEAPRAALS
jgi:hypothetical protein